MSDARREEVVLTPNIEAHMRDRLNRRSRGEVGALGFGHRQVELLFAEIDRLRSLAPPPSPEPAMWTCPRCSGNGRVEMLEHCPVCGWVGSIPSPDKAVVEKAKQEIADGKYRTLQPAPPQSPEPVAEHCKSELCSVSWRMGGCECACDQCLAAMREPVVRKPAQPGEFAALREECEAADSIEGDGTSWVIAASELWPRIIAALRRADEMAQRIAALEAGLHDALNDDAKYPQLRLPQMHRDRINRLLAATGGEQTAAKEGKK